MQGACRKSGPGSPCSDEANVVNAWRDKGLRDFPIPPYRPQPAPSPRCPPGSGDAPPNGRGPGSCPRGRAEPNVRWPRSAPSPGSACPAGSAGRVVLECGVSLVRVGLEMGLIDSHAHLTYPGPDPEVMPPGRSSPRSEKNLLDVPLAAGVGIGVEWRAEEQNHHRRTTTQRTPGEALPPLHPEGRRRE